MALSAVILAGGASRRMGQDKAWLEVGGVSLIERQIAMARRAGASEVMISGRANANYLDLGVRVLFDEATGCGPMAGIKRALEVTAGSHLLVLAVDLPAMTPEWLRWLGEQCGPEQGAVPRLDEALEPLAAIYPTSVRPIMDAFWWSGRYAMQEFARTCAQEGRVRLIPVGTADRGVFANWNRPGDFPAAGQPPTR